ncbi:Uncharacterised protein [Avibacterium paragallinarum]|uniref:Uncharacterized protein n=1 Tax=Avibacterium paragallinarum TaxID=728 RepID=A0A377IBN6_AVIPA|nr:Uncharacterised protein [Avibacterium paragallinarum]
MPDLGKLKCPFLVLKKNRALKRKSAVKKQDEFLALYNSFVNLHWGLDR